MTKETVISKVEKMLRLARDDGATEGEIENALNFAKKLMDEHNLSEADLFLNTDARKLSENCVTRPTVWGSAQGTVDSWFNPLAWCVCSICEVKWYTGWHRSIIRKKARSRKHIFFYGFPEDVDAAVALFEELRIIIWTMARARYPNDGSSKVRQGSYCLGFAQRLQTRAYQMEAVRRNAKAAEEAGLDASCTAIVLRKADAIKKFKEEKLNLSKARSRSVNVSDYGAFATGDGDGAAFPLDAGKLNGATNRGSLQ